MKPASRTISYTVYPSNYTPGDGYKRVKSIKAAQIEARRYGRGSSVDRCIEIKNKRRTFYNNAVEMFVFE